MNWGKTEVARRVERYGTTRTDSVVSSRIIEKSKLSKLGAARRGKRKKKSKNLEYAEPSGNIRSWTAPRHQDPIAEAKKRLAQFEQELAKNMKENRRLSNLLHINIKEKNKLQLSIERLKQMIKQ